MVENRPGTVEEYLASLDHVKQATLRRVIEHILDTFPTLEAKIAWNVPQIHRDGSYVFGVSSAARHLSLAPWSAAVIEACREQLEGEGYIVRKNLFQVPDDWAVDPGLINDLVQRRLDELDTLAE